MNETPSVSAPAGGGPAESVAGASEGGAIVRWANLVVWTLIAVLATLLGIILIPLHLPGGFLIPVAPIIALAANFLIPKLMLAGTGWSAARFMPVVIWAVVTLVGAAPTGDGDLLISGDSHSSAIGLAYLGFGALGAVLGIAFAASPMRRPRGGQ